MAKQDLKSILLLCKKWQIAFLICQKVIYIWKRPCWSSEKQFLNSIIEKIIVTCHCLVDPLLLYIIILYHYYYLASEIIDLVTTDKSQYFLNLVQ